MQLGDEIELLFRPQAGADLVDAELGRHRLGGGGVVAGGHDDLEPELMQRLHRLGGALLDRIGDGDETGKLAVVGQHHHRLAIAAAALRGVREGRNVDAGALHQARVAEEDRAAVEAALDTLPGDRVEVGGLAGLQAFLFGAAEYRLGKGMLAPRLQRGRQAQHLVLLEAGRGFDPGQGRLAFGQGSGLVDDERVDRSEPLQCRGIAHQDAGLGAAAGRHHDRDRRGETERARAGDDQHAHGRDEGVGELR